VIRARFGRNQYDAQRSMAFAHFVRTFVNNAQEEGAHRVPFLGWLAPPYHVQTFAPSDDFDFQERLVRVEIIYREYFFDGASIREVLSAPAVRIDLLASPPDEHRGAIPPGGAGAL
jgi:hypothetical protein